MIIIKIQKIMSRGGVMGINICGDCRWWEIVTEWEAYCEKGHPRPSMLICDDFEPRDTRDKKEE